MDTLNKIISQNRHRNNELLKRIKNGRVNIIGNPTSSSIFPLFEEKSSGDIVYKNEALKSILTKSKVHNYFFSKNNIDVLQQLIRYHVWIQSNKKHIISTQSNNQLKIIMRSIFLQYGKHSNTNIIKQIKELNQLMCNYCIPNILSNIELYIGYKHRVSYLPKPLPHPINLSSTGMKSIKNKLI